MDGRKAYVAVILIFSLLAAFGVWVMIDGAIAWQNRPLVEDAAQRTEQLSMAVPSTGGDWDEEIPYCAGWRG